MTEDRNPRPAPIHTRVTELLGIDYPIVQGGLSYLSYAELAAAVSQAGALGQIGVACFAAPEDLRADIRRYRTLTDRPFGVNFPIGMKPLDGFVEVTLEERAPVISITGGNPETLLKRIQEAGQETKTLVLVAGVRAAKKAQDLGAHAVMAVGFEGGGHLGRDDIGTAVLVPRVVESVAIPVLASGGIADGRGLAASLALGAEGIEMGTRFVAVQESVSHPAYREALVNATETDTIIIERTIGRPARVLRTKFAEHILSVEDALQAKGASREEALQALLPLISGANNTRASRDGDLDGGFVWAGQVVGLINDIPTARELVWRTVAEARAILSRLGTI